MLLMLVVQRVEDGDCDFGVPHVARRRSLLPEAIAEAEVQHKGRATSIRGKRKRHKALAPSV